MVFEGDMNEKAESDSSPESDAVERREVGVGFEFELVAQSHVRVAPRRAAILARPNLRST